MKRRNFLKYSLTGSALLTTFPWDALAADKIFYPHDRIKLGNTGIETSRMAMGTGTSGWAGNSNQTRQLGLKGVADLLKAAFDDGITFWDTANQYGSHPHLKEALKSIDRDKITILTKTNSKTYADVKADLDRFRKEIGTDRLDAVLLHCMTDSKWNTKMKGAMEALSEAKQAGIIRTHGVSCHSLGALETAADEPWVEIDLARYNPGGVQMDADVATVTKVLTRMKQNGKAIIGMKVYGAGELVHKKDECLQFQMRAKFIDGFTLGIESIEQLRDIQKRLPEIII